MSYLLCTNVDGKNFCVVTNVKAKKFELIEVKSESSLSKTWCTPHKSEAMNILRWINEHDPELASKKLEIQEEAKYRTGSFSGI